MIRWENREAEVLSDLGAAVIGMDSAAALDSRERKLLSLLSWPKYPRAQILVSDELS